MTHDPISFYDGLAPFYHLVYADWEASVERQAAALDSVIREIWGESAKRVLDAACGIGTQALGLAKLGYQVTASDLSPESVARARREAEKRRLSIGFFTADMRAIAGHCGQGFDVVIACDNAVPHLLSDQEIVAAFRQFHQCLRPGGGCLISVRDYEKEDLSRRQVKPYGFREEGGIRRVLFQVWEPQGTSYDLTFYFIEDTGGAECRTRVWRSRYYAIGIPKLMALMARAGFADVRRLDDRFFQPLIAGTKPGKE